MKSLLTYVVMVGLPTAGVLGVLHAGRGLRAPYAIGGEWRVSAGPLADSTLVVQQSGEHVSLSVRGVRLAGKLRGDSLVVRAATSSGARACGAEGITTLSAVLDLTAVPRRLAGTLAEGAGCPAERIEATMVPRAAAPRKGH